MAVAIKYVTEPGSGLECVICLEVAEDPWQHGKCGRLVCQQCLRKYGTDKPCPNCRREQPQYFEDNKSKRDIQALKVKCPNVECCKIMEQQQVKHHVRTQCPHTVIPCKYKGLGCDTELKRRDMAAHEQDDKLHLHMALETLNLERQILKKNSNNGSITCAVPYVQKEFLSPPFYTHPNGYHMVLRVDPNGYGAGEGTHVSVFAPILKGGYDAKLKWPLVGDLTFTLLNQLEDDNHHTTSISLHTEHDARIGVHWGLQTFIRHTALARDPVKNTQYLVDDTLYFRVSVEIPGRKPWLECT